MGFTAYGLVRTALSEIMDEALPPGVDIIEGILQTTPKSAASTSLRTRRIGATRQVDMHMSVDAELTIAQVHHISEDVEHEIADHLPGTVAVIHVEPHEAPVSDIEIVVRQKTGE